MALRIFKGHFFGKSVLGFLFFCLGLSSLHAHKIDAMEFEWDPSGPSWQLEGIIDLTYMLPEFRGDDDAEALSRATMMELPAGDWSAIQAKIDATAHSLFAFSFNEEEIPFEVSFPDFDRDPLILPEEPQDVALITVRLTLEPMAGPGELVVYWLDDLEAQLIIIPREDDPYVTIPGGAITLLTVSEEGEASAPEESGISAWMVSGFRHVIPLGADHILFILGLFLLCPRLKPVLGQSLLFTLAHSITLTCAVKGWVSFNTTYIEILIAMSIAWIGLENLWLKKVSKGRVLLIFSFGLLHGLGFASVLGEILESIDSSRHFVPLLGFNIGVEIAQVVVLIVAACLLRLLKSWERRIQIIGSVAIAIAGISWMIERIGTLS